jgi:hypothetical protein
MSALLVVDLQSSMEMWTTYLGRITFSTHSFCAMRKLVEEFKVKNIMSFTQLIKLLDTRASLCKTSRT